MITVPTGAAFGSYVGNYNPEFGQGNEKFYEFEVACMTVQISASEVERDEAMGVVLHECHAIVQGGTAPFQYTWSSVGGTIVSGQGTPVVGVNFPPGTSGSVSLTVTDANTPACSATDTVSVAANPIEFTITNPNGDGTGDPSGTRDQMRFAVSVEAVANQPLPNPPATISFQIRRPNPGAPGGGTVSVTQVTGTLVAGSSPPEYHGSWDVTRTLGRWRIKVESPHRSNTVNFKVDKRGQIVAVANNQCCGFS
ncbi:MAG: hypothetical protein KY445_17390 [Armatimonadetes bacterium]|nr:hypothetical protein [Armatimonadota bacterium]